MAMAATNENSVSTWPVAELNSTENAPEPSAAIGAMDDQKSTQTFPPVGVTVGMMNRPVNPENVPAGNSTRSAGLNRHHRVSEWTQPPTIASASISTSMSGSIKPFTSIIDVAGRMLPNTSP